MLLNLLILPDTIMRVFIFINNFIDKKYNNKYILDKRVIRIAKGTLLFFVVNLIFLACHINEIPISHHFTLVIIAIFFELAVNYCFISNPILMRCKLKQISNLKISEMAEYVFISLILFCINMLETCIIVLRMGLTYFTSKNIADVIIKLFIDNFGNNSLSILIAAILITLKDAFFFYVQCGVLNELIVSRLSLFSCK